MLSKSERHILLQVARSSVEAAVRGNQPVLPAAIPKELLEPRGAFVTLRANGELRGCIGYIDSPRPLVETVQDAAAKAAVEDFRFQPVTPDEVPDIEIEISALSPIKQISDVGEIEVGTHGLIVELGNFRGLLLPQVPIEHGWDRETFVNQTMRKAGLSPQFWKNPSVRMYTFTAEVFEENVGANNDAA